jgi:outer membrane biosynthesis protein TonB
VDEAELIDEAELTDLGLESAKQRRVVLRWCKAKKEKQKEQKKNQKSKEKPQAVKVKEEEKEKLQASKKETKKKEKQKEKSKEKGSKPQAPLSDNGEPLGEKSALAFGSEFVFAGAEEMEEEEFNEHDLDTSMASLARKVSISRTLP